MLCGATMEQLLPSGATLAERSISGQFRPAHDDLNSIVFVFRVRYRGHCGRDEQPKAPEARMALAPDHQMVVDRYAQRTGRGPDLARHLDVVTRRLGVAGRMIAHQAALRVIVLISLAFCVRMHRVGTWLGGCLR